MNKSEMCGIGQGQSIKCDPGITQKVGDLQNISYEILNVVTEIKTKISGSNPCCEGKNPYEDCLEGQLLRLYDTLKEIKETSIQIINRF